MLDAIIKFMFEDVTKRSGQFIYDYQPLMAGSFALAAAFVTALILGYQGKRERAFRMKQHEIEMQNKRYATAVMLEAEIGAVDEMANLELVIERAEKEEKKFKNLSEGGDGGDADDDGDDRADADDESLGRPFFSPMDKSFLNNYSHYIENMPLMRAETVEAVSRFYFCAARLSEIIGTSNATIEREREQEKDTRDFSLMSINRYNVRIAARNAQTELEQTLPLLKEEIEEAQIELNRLKGVKEEFAANAPSS